MLTKYLTSLAVAAIVALSIALGFAAPATANHDGSIKTMVTNFGQASDDSTNLSSGIYWSQAFTTGSHAAGYILTSIRVKSEDTEGDAFEASLCGASEGAPTAYCSTLTPPSSFAMGTLSFTAPRDLHLANSTTYTVKFFPSSATVKIDATTSNGEDAGKASGSSIDNVHRGLLNNVWADSTKEIRIEINAREKPSSRARLGNIFLTGATLSKTFTPFNPHYRTNQIASTTTQITINPTKVHGSATIAYFDANDDTLADADTGTANFQVDIDPGDTLVKIEVTAEDGTTTKTYSIAALRAVQTTEESESCGNSRSNSCEAVSNEDVPVYGTIDTEGQEDWIDVVLDPRKDYIISVQRSRQLGSDSLTCRTLDIYGPAPNFTRVGGFKSGINRMFDANIALRFTPENPGSHKLKVGGSCYKPNAPRSNHLDTGNYKVTVADKVLRLSVSEPSNADLPATTATAGRLLPTGAVTGKLSITDSDWYQFHVTSTNIYRFPTQGLEYVVVMDDDGNRVWDNQAAAAVGGNRYFRPNNNRVHYIAAINTHTPGDDYPRSYEIEVEPIPHGHSSQVELQPLTAAFVAMPLEHDGTAFTFQLEFSDDITATADDLRQHGFTVNGGSVTSVAQVDDRADLWSITVTPAGSGNVSILLNAGRACDDTSAVCTSDGSPLSSGIGKFILGPPTVSVANAADTAEASGATLDFAVTLSRPSDSDITVEYATSDGTATEGDDYTNTSGTLTFTAGQTSKTINVPVLEDTDNEGNETVTLTLSDASGAVLGTSSATGTIINVATTVPDVTIAISAVPDQHDGSDPFTFNLTLSSNLQVGYQAIADAVDTTGATVTKAKRTERGSNLRWTITLTPSSQDAVNISIDADAICDRGGSPCNSNAVSATVAGPN